MMKTRADVAHKKQHALHEAKVRASVNLKADTIKRQSQIAVAKKVNALLGKRSTLKQILKKGGHSAYDYNMGETYLKNPVTQTMPARKAARVAKSTPAPKNAFPHMNYGNRRKRTGTLFGKKQLADFTKQKLNVRHPGYHGTSFSSIIGRGDLFSTDKTLKVPGRTMKGTKNPSGIMMGMNMHARIIINATKTMSQLHTTFPMAVKRGIVAASDLVGRRMLDIIEPYVPKDRGYLYQSAKSNADQGHKGMISFANGVAFPGSETYGVTISYNTPYAEIVYFGGDRHGAVYNAAHGVQEKGELETARWIEVAMSQKPMEFRNLLSIYANHVTAALNSSSVTKGMSASVK
jgi:hypothetical protein